MHYLLSVLLLPACSTYTPFPVTGGCDQVTVPLHPGEVSSATGFSAEEASAAFGVRTGAITLPDIGGSWEATIELGEIGDVTEIIAGPEGGEGCHPGESWLQIHGTWDVVVEGVTGVPRDLSMTNLRAFENGTYEVTAHATFAGVDLPDLSAALTEVAPEDVEALEIGLEGPPATADAQIILDAPDFGLERESWVGSWAGED